jgi:gliding motility-associated protein GldL
MFKIQHWPGASAVLILGLSTEAFIFTMSAFEPVHEDPDWTLVYPELAGVENEKSLEEVAEESSSEAIEEPTSVVEQLDNLLEEAKIDSELLEKLGEGFRNLAEETHKLSDITDATVATNEYVSSVKHAAEKVEDLAQTYEKASESLGVMQVASEEGTSFGEQMKSLAEKLHQLNSVYELQLKASQQQMETYNQFYGGISELLSNLQESVEDTKRYKENIAELSKNLQALNTIYGNMLTAMTNASNIQQ